MSEESDEQLYARWMAGDEAAGTALTRRRLPGIRQLLNSLLSGAEAQDALQEVFERLAKRAKAGKEIETVKTFLAGMARNVVREQLRKRNKQGVNLEYSLEDISPGQSQEIQRKEENHLLLKALHRMPVDDQILLCLRYWERMRTKQLAVVLELNHSTARSKLQRAETRLRKLLEELADSPEALKSTIGSLTGWAREHGKGG